MTKVASTNRGVRTLTMASKPQNPSLNEPTRPYIRSKESTPSMISNNVSKTGKVIKLTILGTFFCMAVIRSLKVKGPNKWNVRLVQPLTPYLQLVVPNFVILLDQFRAHIPQLYLLVLHEAILLQQALPPRNLHFSLRDSAFRERHLYSHRT